MLKNSYQERSVSDRGRTVYTMWLCPRCKERVHDLGFGIQPAKMQSRETTFKRCAMCSKQCDCIKANVQKESTILF